MGWIFVGVVLRNGYGVLGAIAFDLYVHGVVGLGFWLIGTNTIYPMAFLSIY